MGYEVLADLAVGVDAGCDGTEVFMFSSREDADEFAAKNTCYGRPCEVFVDSEIKLADGDEYEDSEDDALTYAESDSDYSYVD